MYKALIEQHKHNEFYALVVRIDADDNTNHVCHSYKGKYFKSLSAAEKSTNKHIAKLEG